MSKKTVVCAVASVLAVAVSFTTSAEARLQGDFTDDTALNASSPSIVDVFDFMIWNHFKFTTNPNGHLVGDENGDGIIDGLDFIEWNSNKFADDGAGTCNAATTACITNAEYLTALSSAPRNIPDLSGSAILAPVFSVDNTNSILSVTLQPDTFLQAFSVITPSAANGFGTNFANGDFFINGSGEFSMVESTYFGGRQQWIATAPLGMSDGGWDDTIVNPNSVVATFPTGSLAGSSIFWNLQAGSVGIGSQAIPATDFTWQLDESGNWNVATNWDPIGTPNNNRATAIFDNAISSPQTVYTNEGVTVKAITFSNTNSYVIAGAGSVTIEADSGDASASVSAGSHQFQAVVNIASNTNVDVGSGAELVFNNALNLGGNIVTKTGAGTLSINNQLNTGGGSINGTAGIIAGSGIVGGDLNNSSATVAPGNSGGSSTSVLSVAGNYAQSAGGALAIEIDGAEPGERHDQLQVNATATLDGALDIDPTAEYTDPENRGDHDDLVLLVANSVDGTFSSVDYDGTALSIGANYIGDNQNGDDGLFRVLEYASTQVTVINYLALGGDANGDLIVDGADFLIWNQNKFTAGQNWTAGDFNGDGVVDGADFLIWNTNKFMSADVASAVPEPSSSLMILIGLIGFGRRRR